MGQMTDFQRFIKTNKLKQKQVAEYLETSPQYINQVVRGLCNLSDEKYEKLVQAGWDISMLDIPPYIKVPATVTVFDGVVPAADEQDIEKGVDMSIYPAEVVEEIKAEVVEEIEAEIVVPIIPHEIALKTDVDIRKYIEDNASELEHFDPRTITAEVDSAERICTTSMSPAFMPSDRIFIKFLEEKSKITDGEIYYFDTRTRPTMIRMVKILDDGRLLLQALNPRYGDIYLRREDIINIGKIKGLYRDTFGDQYAEIETVRRKKEEQIDKLLAQNQEALKIIGNLIPVVKDKMYNNI